MTGLNYYWRLLATGYNFLTFSLGGLLIALTLLPLARVLPGSQARRQARARQVVCQVFRYFVWQMQFTGVITFDPGDVRRLQREARGRLVIANHPSLIDVVLLMSLLPHSCCVVKQAMWRNPWLGGVMRGAGYISNAAESDELLSRSQAVLAHGYPLVMFPEGTRTVPGEPLQFQRGAANIAVRLRASLLPVVIRCEPPTLRKSEPWYRIPPRKAHYTLRVQAPIDPAQVIDLEAPPSLATRHLNQYLENYYRRVIDNA